MAGVPTEQHPRYFLHSLRSYTFSPLSTATTLVEQEYSEMADERDAYSALSDRVTEITPVRASDSPAQSATLTDHSPSDNKMDRVCTAYRETVMDVPHYSDVYEEPLEVHVSEEFGSEFADQLTNPGTTFTETFKIAFQGRLKHAILSRQQLLTALTEESRSITEARNSLDTLFAQLDTTILPDWYHENFAGKMNAIAENRQQMLQNRPSEAYLDEHSLCTYLYMDESWTYPVLTAVARLREAVTTKGSNEDRCAGDK